MKELIIRITLYDLKEIDNTDIVNIHEYFDGYFPNNKGISHYVKEITDHKEVFRIWRI